MEHEIELKAVKIFTDGADLDQMLEQAKMPHIAGFTTNPTLMRKAGVKDYIEFSKRILSHITDKPVSFEVIADDFAEMERQALKIAAWGPNVYVKIPVMNSRGENSYSLIHELSHQNVQLNVTAVFDLEQVQDTAAALVGGAPSVISVFAGRIADTGRDPVPVMKDALKICRDNDPNIELLWASPRELLNIVQADQIGVDIITVTPDITKKLASLNQSLRDFSRETVQMFKSDAETAGYKL